MANPFIGGGGVKYTPEKVKAIIDETAAQLTQEDLLKQAAQVRDLLAADLLEIDDMMDSLDDVIDEQMKDLELPGGDGFCDGDVITWECYKKAKDLLRAAPAITNGYDPVVAINSPLLFRRTGPYILNCKDFDPDTFFDQVDGKGNLVVGPGALGRSIELDNDKQPVDELQNNAKKNQKNWSLLVLFWDVLWGRSDKKGPDSEEFSSDNLTNDQKEVIAQTSDLPNIIDIGRPQSYGELMWEAYPISSGPVKSANNKRSAARAVDLGNISKSMKDPGRGIPSIKTGFLLPILVGFLGLIPKVLKPVMDLRRRLDKATRVFKKIPIVGSSIYNVIKVILDAIFYAPAIINNIFIEICIILALLPKAHPLDPFYKTMEDYGDGFKTEGSGGALTNVINKMEIAPTHGGISLDCLEKAQAIVNRVNQEVVTDG